jgi:response regulator RpfG family c-di-GMP phosphodiesterase
MDRISALRNVEDALADFESGEADLQATERRVLNVLRTYATEFEGDELCAYRASGDDRADGLVVVAESEAQARSRVADLVGATDSIELPFELEKVR